MFKNYITIALRNLKGQMMYSFINIIGLAVGMACSLVIFLYVYSEWNTDRHFKNGDRVYRIGVGFFNMGQFANGPEILGEFLPKEFEGIEAFTGFQQNGKEVLRINDQTFKERVFYVDSSFFKVFSYDFKEGAKSMAMKEPHSMVLSESMARKYFNDVHAIGKIIEIGKEKVPYVITGIINDDSRNAHLKASIWISRDRKGQIEKAWTSAAVYSYVLLREHVSKADLERALDQIIAKHVYPSSVVQDGKVSLEDFRQNPNSVKFFVHNLREIYLKSKLSLELSPGGNETNLYIFSIIAFFILILAAVNFINLSTARAARRAKEVGIRKSLGTTRGKLVVQFLLESVILSLFSMVIGLGFAELFTFMFYWITGLQLLIDLWTNLSSLFGLLAFALLVGIMAGIYPAFYLTSFQPVKVLKGNVQLSGSQNFRNALVILQFSISIALIICTSIILRQLNFMSGKDLGFDQKNVVTIDNLYQMKGSSAVTFKNRLEDQTEVVDASLHSGEPGSKAILSFYTYKTREMKDELTINTYFGDADYLKVFGFRLLKGRAFDKDLASDSNAVILNESAVRALNIQQDPIGAVVNDNMRIIGVVSNFHWESLRTSIAPAAILLQSERTKNILFHQLALKVKSSAIATLLKKAEEDWKKFVPDEPMEYHFLDENFGQLLRKEEVLGKAIGFFTVLAILISCLGLFGLAAYTTEQRTKEIGIRKVLGASASNIVLMLNRQFSVLVIISILIAIPISYYAAAQWLSGFAYHISLDIWIFLAGGIAGLTIAILTVMFHSLKASQSNPADTLKCE